MSDDPKTIMADEVDWGTTAFLLLSPIAAVVLVALCVRDAGLHSADAAIFVGFYLLTGLSITAGYHRLYSHATYQCRTAVRLGYLIFGAAALQNPVLNWAANHRYHHQFVDHDGDPYNIKRGFWWAHMVWIFRKDRPGRDFSNANDLKHDRLVMWQKRYYWPLALGVGFGVPTLIGWAFGRPLAGFAWGGLLRVVAVQHATFMINSVAHTFGTQPYTVADTSRNNPWAAVLALGEGLHNFHHAFANDYRSSLHWYQWDPTKWWIRSLKAFGLAWGLRTASERLILHATMATAYRATQPTLDRLPADRREQIGLLLEQCQARFDANIAAYIEHRIAYREGASGAMSGWERRREQASHARAMLTTWTAADRARREYIKILRHAGR